MTNSESILHLLEKDAKLTPAKLALMLEMEERDVALKIEEFEKKNIILGYKAMIDWEKTESEPVSALIEVKVTPQRGQGFDRIAERIWQYPEVSSVYLMSGGFDLTVIIEGASMKEVALFVARKLAPLDSVAGTATHFVLKKYKDKGVVFCGDDFSEKRVMMP